jgi:hypothetical protein
MQQNFEIENGIVNHGNPRFTHEGVKRKIVEQNSTP